MVEALHKGNMWNPEKELVRLSGTNFGCKLHMHWSEGAPDSRGRLLMKSNGLLSQVLVLESAVMSLAGARWRLDREHLEVVESIADMRLSYCSVNILGFAVFGCRLLVGVVF